MSIWGSAPAQGRVATLLRSEAGHPGGAYLFTGPSGSGKTTMARLFAAALVCPEQCGSCDVCRRAVAGSHPDISTHEPEGYTFAVDAIRDMVGRASETPIEAVTRVFILEEADRIAERSQNALLKALEDSGRSTWILIARSPGLFLPTVLSRCRHVEFPPIDPEMSVKLLAEEFDLPLTEGQNMMRVSGNNFALAKSLASDSAQRELRALAFRALTSKSAWPGWALQTAGQVAEMAKASREEVESGGSEELGEFDRTIGAASGTGAARKRIVDRQKRAARRAEFDTILRFIGWLGIGLRDIAALRLGAPDDAVVSDDYLPQLTDTAPRASATTWLNIAERCLEATLAIGENATPTLVLESLLLDLVRSRLL